MRCNINCPFSLSLVFLQIPTSHALLYCLPFLLFFFVSPLFFPFSNTTERYIYIYIFFFSLSWPNSIQNCWIMKSSHFSIQPGYFGEMINCCLFSFVSFLFTFMYRFGFALNSSTKRYIVLKILFLVQSSLM
jgi:hypothetical protein